MSKKHVLFQGTKSEELKYTTSSVLVSEQQKVKLSPWPQSLDDNAQGHPLLAHAACEAHR